MLNLGFSCQIGEKCSYGEKGLLLVKDRIQDNLGVQDPDIGHPKRVHSDCGSYSSPLTALI